MYVGGMRAYLPEPVLYSCQSEWLAAPDPNTGSAVPNIRLPSTELVYLQLIEHEVSATEDAPLRDPALGGPDTAQRTRLSQHIVRAPIGPAVTLCSTAQSTLTNSVQSGGQAINWTTMQLTSQTTLQASFIPPTGASNPCSPTAQTGYLGAENQLIRVQVSQLASGLPAQLAGAPGPGAGWTGPSGIVLAWAFDDASALYPVTSITVNPAVTTGGVTTPATTTLQLGAAPVDAYHQPTTSQYAEVLFPTTQLDGHGNFVAAPTGFLVPNRVRVQRAEHDPHRERGPGRRDVGDVQRDGLREDLGRRGLAHPELERRRRRHHRLDRPPGDAHHAGAGRRGDPLLPLRRGGLLDAGAAPERAEPESSRSASSTAPSPRTGRGSGSARSASSRGPRASAPARRPGPWSPTAGRRSRTWSPSARGGSGTGGWTSSSTRRRSPAARACRRSSTSSR